MAKKHSRVQAPPVEQIFLRRAASKVPGTQWYRPTWLMALEMLDELAAAGCVRRC